jgi:hypothetical protein
MNTITVQSHPPQQEVDTVHITVPATRSTLSDRLSLRLGLWLLLSAARRAARREEILDRARRLEHARVLQQYERDAAHTQLLLATRAWR